MILVTEIGFLQRIFSMVDLTLAQWGICLGIALTLVVVEELIKVFLRRRSRTNVEDSAARTSATAARIG
jgi:Ca2+-transporting ATPase